MNDFLKNEIEQLYNDGMEIKKQLREKNQTEYQVWYSKCIILIKQLIPDRYDEFVGSYGNKKERGVHTWLYDYGSWEEEKYDYYYALKCFETQIGIIKSALDIIDYKMKDIISLLEAELFDDELLSAQNLLNKGYLRAAGAICGVVLESHFKTIMKNHNLVATKSDMAISDYNDLFKKEGIYDVPKWRNIQYLGDIRNLCDHSKDREPTKDEVEELLNGTIRTIKTVF